MRRGGCWVIAAVGEGHESCNKGMRGWTPGVRIVQLLTTKRWKATKQINYCAKCYYSNHSFFRKVFDESGEVVSPDRCTCGWHEWMKRRGGNDLPGLYAQYWKFVKIRVWLVWHSSAFLGECHESGLIILNIEAKPQILLNHTRILGQNCIHGWN